MMRLVRVALLGLLSACAARTSLPPMDNDVLSAKRYQVEIIAHDGARIGVTVWQPELAAGATAPLVLHTHGFGLQRMDGRFGLYENLIPSGLIAKKLWQQGAWVMTWDQRGHGDSDGIINVMDPEKEVRDVTTLLDWAEANIPRLRRDADGDIRVGMIGESYGGGVQLLASVRDARIDAIVPITTWFDLSTALAPQDVPKGGWIKVLYLMGDWWNFRKLHPTLRENFDLARDGIIREELKRDYASHGLAHYCENGEARALDVLLVQGFRDVLFDVDQALAAQDCLQQAGGDVHLIAQSGGHLLPLEQHSPTTPVWYWDKWLHCNGERQRTDALVTDWMRAKLDGAEAPSLPSVCVSMRDWGVALNHWPGQYSEITLPPVTLYGERSGGWRWWTGAREWLASLRTEKGLSKRFAEAHDGRLRRGFIPLYTATNKEQRVGSAQLLLQADNAATGTPVLAAIAIRRAGSARWRLVNDQLQPVRTGEQVSLPPMAVAMEQGDQLGLMLFSRHDQFNTLEMDFADGVTFTGTLQLPESVQTLVQRADPALRRPVVTHN